MKKMTQVLDKVLEVVLCVMVVLMVFGCVWQIFTRFVLRDPSDWTEEFVKYTLIWTTMLGVPYAYGKDKHISIGFVTGTFTRKGAAMDKIFNDILILVLSVVIMIVGGIMVSMNAVGQVSAALQIPMQIYYAGVPVCGVMMVLYSIPRLSEHFTELKNSRKEAEE